MIPNKDFTPQEDVVKAFEKIYHIDGGEGKFMRKGQAGNWRKELTEEQVEMIREWEERQLKDTDFAFQYE
jgi:hypothetical protein